ncbi:ABC transporter family substrate-binding protein [Pengzhenrongella sicca]|uniref:ABC transporter family substrate-binding protein n=1 Tax=Pengzhenrongella sicca TaxID=2819238 RepID=A0A8A4ZBN5_9MICO|nr:ABC transporter family substrate-binding protein [Pengzhenrongella sicca]QTE28831.1 ABC transporter family substrate-binding protein [Pengzhenrongella sicca]
MSRRRHAGISAVAMGALLLAACGSIGGGTADPDAGGELALAITIGVEQLPDGYNAFTADSGSVVNAYVNNLTQQGFTTLLPDGSIEPNSVFGSYEKTSDDPLTVRYTFAADAVWSDGTPIDFDDALLTWAARSGTYTSGEVDADGAPVALFTASNTSGWDAVAKPVGEPGDRSFTLTFAAPFADWEVLADGFMPAHVAAEQGGLSAADDGAALVAAIESDDVAALAGVAAFWNAGWAYQENLPALPDAALIPASGPYAYASASGGTLTLHRNEKWWGEPGATESIVFTAVDAAEMVQALANGEIDSFDPANPTADMVAQLADLGPDVVVETGESYAYSHIDLDSRAGGLFEDARVRQAFLTCVPRQELVDKFAAPITATAQLLNLREFLPAQAEYDAVLAAVPSATLYDRVDLDGAAQLLEQAGVAAPVQVRLLYAEQSGLRADQVALIKASCDQAGFDVVGQPAQDLFGVLAEPGTWDAALFGWTGSGLVTENQAFYVTGGGLNYGGYSNATVDALWDQIVTVADRAAAVPLKTELEEELWADPYNVMLYATPGLTAHSARVSGPGYNPTQSGSTWNAQTWTKSAG